MSDPHVANQVRPNFYLDSVALMRLSNEVSAEPGVETAALMIGSETNKALMREAGLLTEDGAAAGPNDLVIAVRADNRAAADRALASAEALLERPGLRGGAGEEWHPRTLDTALAGLPGANLALISVPGEFAAAEARKALERGLHVMLFSDNVPIEDERDLKETARELGLLMMGPDCGTAIIGGVPLAFANEVPRGGIGIVAASGTGLQEVSCLIARAGQGVSHAIGVGGRDLKQAVGGIMTLMAIDALDADARTERIVLISKPPEPAVARAVLERVGRSRKHVTICFIGLEAAELPENAAFASTLRAAAEDALGGVRVATSGVDAAALARGLGGKRRWIRGLFSGGTLCAEAQLVLRAAGHEVHSNVPVPGARDLGGEAAAHTMIDLGADEYTVGRPHPMIDPSVRNELLPAALADPSVAVVLLDLVIGYGAHEDPAGDLVAALAGTERKGGPVLLASVCGTEGDPQGYSRQVQALEAAGVIVAGSNAEAAELAAAIAAR